MAAIYICGGSIPPEIMATAGPDAILQVFKPYLSRHVSHAAAVEDFRRM